MAAVGAGAAGPRFLPDDPLRVDPDDLPIARPAEVDLSTAYDVIEHTFHHRPDGDVPPAVNVNTLGEVPDSSWFTNRIGARPMTVEEIVRGAATVGPAGRRAAADRHRGQVGRHHARLHRCATPAATSTS